MQLTQPRGLLHGAIGGLAAGLIVALWFLVLDLASGQPLHTPTALARAVLGDQPAAGPALVITYTILHFGIFTLLGVTAAAFLRATSLSPGLLIGAVFGLAVVTSVHYGALLATGARVLTVVPPLHVLAANLLGGMVMMTYLHLATREPARLGPGVLRDHPLVVNGLITGLIGAGTVALWFLLLDVLGGRPFFTPAALGAALLLGATSPAEVSVTLPLVAAYTMLHLAAFATLGILIEWAAERLERMPAMWIVGVLIFVLLEALFIGIVGSLGHWVLGTLGYWAVAVGNLLAIVAMAMRVRARHPGLQSELANAPAGSGAG